MPQPPRLKLIRNKGWTQHKWYIRYWDGRTKHKSTGACEAETGRAERELERFLETRRTGQRGPGYPNERSIADVLACYAEERGPQTADFKRVVTICRNLLSWWGDRNVDAITERTCDGYDKWRRDGVSHVAAGTVRRELSCLRAALRWDERHGRLLNAPHVFLPQAPDGLDRWLTRSEAGALLRAARREPQSRLHLPLFILIGLYSGARRGAILDLRWQAVDLVRGTINFNPPTRIQTAKRRPVVPVPRQLLWFLRKAQKRATCPYVIAYRGKRVLNVKKSFKRAARLAGLDIGTHALRHTAGTWMAQAGVPLWQIGGYLGHSDQRTTAKYLHHHVDYLSDARKALEG